jgi:Na+-driven multidrug efflux pump
MIELPLAYLLAMRLGFGERGIFYAIVAADISFSIVGTIVFRRGKWKLRKV